MRAEIPFAVLKNGSAVSGASVLINIRGGGPATIYAAETGSTTISTSGSTTTTVEGRIDGWLDEGSYDMTVSGSTITTYMQPIEVVSGKTVLSFDGARLAAGTVAGAALANNAVTGAKIAAGTITKDKLATDVVPVGTIIMWWRPNASTPVPSGWQILDGTTLGSAQHDFVGGGTINLPNFFNMFPIGADPSKTQGTAGTATTAFSQGATNAPGIGGTGGINAWNLRHSHTVNSHAHDLSNHVHGVPDHLHWFPGVNHLHSLPVKGPYGIGNMNSNGSFYLLSGSTSTNAADRSLGAYTQGADRSLTSGGPSNNNSGPATPDTNNQLNALTDSRPQHIGVVFLIKVKNS